MAITGSCHCGACSYVYDHTPRWATSCNCSICRRLGVLWIYAFIPRITVTGPTISYTRAQKSLAFHSCKTCGCTTHWENLAPEGPEARMAVNLLLADPEVIKTVRIRHFDGANTWEFLD